MVCSDGDSDGGRMVRIRFSLSENLNMETALVSRDT